MKNLIQIVLTELSQILNSVDSNNLLDSLGIGIKGPKSTIGEDVRKEKYIAKKKGFER